MSERLLQLPLVADAVDPADGPSLVHAVAESHRLSVALGAQQERDRIRERVLAFAKRLFKEVPLCTGCDMDHGWDDHVQGIFDAAIESDDAP